MVAISWPTNDLLHRYPGLYEKVFKISTASICLELYQEMMGRQPVSALDIGCGPGRELADMARKGVECVGVDFVPTMIEYAKENYSEVEFQLADMRKLRLHRTFDMITCLGSCLNYMLTNEDLEKALSTFRAHCHRASLVIIEPCKTSSFVGMVTPPTEFVIPDGKLRAVGRSSYTWDQVTQVIHRSRTWTFQDGSAPIEDAYSLRLLFSQELKYFLERAGFEVVAMQERQISEMYGKSLFVLARVAR